MRLRWSAPLEQARAVGKFLASFIRSHWHLEDYPLRVWRRPGESPPGHRWQQYTWTAQIINWGHMRGDGFSRDEAIQDLRARFEAFRTSNPLPRPGRGAALKIELAPSIVVEGHSDIVNDILERVIGIDPDNCLVTDESSLWDFHGAESNGEYHRRIALLYGVDTTDLEPPTLAAIAVRIRERRGACPPSARSEFRAPGSARRCACLRGLPVPTMVGCADLGG